MRNLAQNEGSVNWGGQTLNYRGSIISMFYNRQAVGIFKCCTTVI